MVSAQNDGCSFSQAFAEVVASVQAQNGEVLPFTVVDFGWATKYYLPPMRPGYVAYRSYANIARYGSADTRL